MKLGVCVSAFDGNELLIPALKQIREHVDFIVVLYQNRSWFGRPALPYDLEVLKQLGNLADKVELWEPPFIAKDAHDASDLERLKREHGRETCYVNGCTHYLDMDVDEFYFPEQFKYAKQYVEDNNIDFSTIYYDNYFGNPHYRQRHDSLSTSFICKLDMTVEKSQSKAPGVLKHCDRTRTYCAPKESKLHHFPRSEIIMHNYNGFRRNLKHKFNETSRINLERGQINNIIKDTENMMKTNNYRMSANPFNFNRGGNMYFEYCEDFFNIADIFSDNKKYEIPEVKYFIKLVLFDLDGVLIDMCDNHYHAFNMALSDVGYSKIPYDEHLNLYNGLSTKKKLNILKTRGKINNHHMDMIYNLKQKYTVSMIDTIEKDENKIELMTWLKENGYIVGVVSNSIRDSVEGMLKQLGLIDIVDVWYGNEDFGSRIKPDSFPYTQAMDDMECSYIETLIVEDSPRGIESAEGSLSYVYKVKNAEEVTLQNIKKVLKELS